MSPPSQLPATIKNDNNIVAADGDESGGAVVAGAAERGEKAVAGVGADVEAINGDDENKVEEVGKVLASVAVTINHGGANDTTEESEDASKGEEERCSNFDDDGNNGATSSSHPPDTGVSTYVQRTSVEQLSVAVIVVASNMSHGISISTSKSLITGAVVSS